MLLRRADVSIYPLFALRLEADATRTPGAPVDADSPARHQAGSIALRLIVALGTFTVLDPPSCFKEPGHGCWARSTRCFSAVTGVKNALHPTTLREGGRGAGTTPGLGVTFDYRAADLAGHLLVQRRRIGPVYHRYFKQLRALAGLPGLDWYELRNAAATMLLERGMTPCDVAIQLGHTDGGRLVCEL